jgi:hypothetical protein
LARTLLQLIEQTAIRSQLPFFNGTANSSGGSTTTIVDDELKRFSDNRWNNHQLYIDGGSPTIRNLICTDFTSSSGTVTFTPTIGAAPNSLDFMILPFDRDTIVNEIVNAVLKLHNMSWLTRPVEVVGLVTGSPLYNAGFDYWTGANTVDGWARNGSGTVERERASANVWGSSQSLKLSTQIDYVALGEPHKRWLEDLRGHTARLFCAVKTAVAAKARVNLYSDANNYSGYHTGGGGWEILDTGDITISETAANIDVRLDNAGTAAVYFADPWLATSASIRDIPYPQPVLTKISTIEQTVGTQRPDATRGRARHLGRHATLDDWEEHGYHDEQTTTFENWIHFNKVHASERRLIVRGSGPLAVPSSDSDNVEVDRSEALLIADVAAAELCRKASIGAPPGKRSDYGNRARALEIAAQETQRRRQGTREAVTIANTW